MGSLVRIESQAWVEIELATALELAVPVGVGEVGVVLFTSVCMSCWIWVSAPSELNWASWATNAFGSSGLIGLWDLSCAVSSVKNVEVKSAPGLLAAVVVDDEEVVGEVDAV